MPLSPPNQVHNYFRWLGYAEMIENIHRETPTMAYSSSNHFFSRLVHVVHSTRVDFDAETYLISIKARLNDDNNRV